MVEWQLNVECLCMVTHWILHLDQNLFISAEFWFYLMLMGPYFNQMLACMTLHWWHRMTADCKVRCQHFIQYLLQFSHPPTPTLEIAVSVPPPKKTNSLTTAITTSRFNSALPFSLHASRGQSLLVNWQWNWQWLQRALWCFTPVIWLLTD